jgi:RNA chaperone Hfq
MAELDEVRQSIFLNFVKDNKLPVKVLMMNGGIIEGVVKGFDKFSIDLEEPVTGKIYLLFKHGIINISYSPEANT